MDLGLAERVYVLTGATQGLGFATAECLVADGARVVVSSRDAGRVEAAVARLGGPARAHGITADLADKDTPPRLVEAAREAFGRIDGALLSTGGPPRTTAAAATDEQWRASFENVFLGAVRAIRLIGGALGPGGAIAVVLSSSARTPIPGLALSNGLRPGLAAAAKDMADELGPRGVRVVGLMPGRFRTARMSSLDDSGHATDIPLQRIGDPAEFGRVAAFVLSPAASYVTGTSIAVDGGLIRST